MNRGKPTFFLIGDERELIRINKKNFETVVDVRRFEPSLRYAAEVVAPTFIAFPVAAGIGPLQAFATRLRARSDALADAPLIALTDRAAVLPMRHLPVDDCAAIDSLVNDLPRVLNRWHRSPNDNIERLVVTFGTAAVVDLIVKLRRQMRESLVALRDGKGATIAHRMAGACGTLGYGEASKVWLQFDGSDIGDVTIVTRKAIYAIGIDIARLQQNDGSVEPDGDRQPSSSANRVGHV